MQEEIIIDNNLERWIPVLDAYRAGEPLVCPCCGSGNVIPTVKCVKENIGYAIFECRSCKKTGWFSRIWFNDGMKGP